ncbi:hypothetical protein ADIARSV_1205 [Arcticibacter svalbardensis MN12-7]|uniref:Uncharacterized protein n=1 Tax=Arcticibacter svalbardensis MN12-7 TaxID=1150600 RepID=R9H334_9SPHI|nr:hypothetical protein [Arcticibacter svalbardensis]EOR95599.1 hypothetical protein ADIARSV_1205 [Arcticibacter svalbardensis MN12-7]
MSKDKGVKNVKKAPAAEGTKHTSEYQSGKKGGFKTEATPPVKKK